MALLVPLGRKGTELQVLGEAVPKCAWTHPGSGIIERVGLGLPGALTLGVRAGGPEVSTRGPPDSVPAVKGHDSRSQTDALCDV